MSDIKNNCNRPKLKKYRFELRRKDTLEIVSIFIEAYNLLEAAKKIEKEYVFVDYWEIIGNWFGVCMKFRFLMLAKRLLELSEHPEHKHSCIIARGNKIISFGVNKNKTSPHSRHPHKRIHAELSAILNAKRLDIAGATMYIYREHKNGTTALSRPCPFCLELIKETQIKKICYSDYNGFKEEFVNVL